MGRVLSLHNCLLGCVLVPSSNQLFFLMVLYFYLQWHTAGAEIKVRSVEIPELGNDPLKPGVGQSIAVHASLIARTWDLFF